jgi:hypothetical protein
MRDAAVEFHRHVVRTVVIVQVRVPGATDDLHLALGSRQAVGPLHPMDVPVLQQRMSAIGDIGQGGGELTAPAEFLAAAVRWLSTALDPARSSAAHSVASRGSGPVKKA